MNDDELWFYGALIVIAIGPSTCSDTDGLVIGVIADTNVQGPSTFSHRVYGFNVTYVWISVDTDEIFHVLNAVQQLDGDPSVDIIIHGDVGEASLRLPHLLQTRTTPLVLWGIKRTRDESAQIDGLCTGDDTHVQYMDSPGICCEARKNGLTNSNVTIKNAYVDVIPGSVTELLLRLKLKYVLVFHDTESEHEASDLIDHLSAKGILIIAINVDLVETVEGTILKLYQAYVKDATRLHFLVICRFQCVRKVVWVANTFDHNMSTRKLKTLLKQFSTWFIVLYGYEGWMSREIRACAYDLDNVAIVTIPDWKGLGTQDLVEAVEDVLLELKKMQPDVDLIPTSWRNDAIKKLIQAAASRHPSVYCQGFNIDTLLWAANDERTFSNVGYIDMSGHLMVTSDLFPNTKYGYNKRKFLVSTLEYSPFVMSTIYENGTKTYHGFCMDLLTELALTLNFTFVMTEPEDGKWGSYIDQGKQLFNGLIGQLQQREVDIVAAPISIQVDRSTQMDFTYPFYYEFTTIVMKRTDPMQRKWRTLVDPLKWEVLVCIGASLFIATIFLWTLEKWNPFYKTEQNEGLRRQNGGLNNWHNSFWYMYGALLCQGGVHLPDSVTGRTFVSCWWLFCIIVVGTYCGNLIAFLTVTKDKPPFSDLKELVEKKDDFKWGTLGGTFWEMNFIHMSKVTLYRDIGRGLVEFNRTDPGILSLSPADHINKVLQGGYAWIGDKTYIDFSIATQCDLVRSKDEFLPMTYAFGFQNNSPHSFIFADKMMKIHESGLLKIWKRKWWPRANFCEKDRISTQTQPITLPDVQSAFYVCVLGITLGFMVLLSELVVYRYQQKKRRWETTARQLSSVELVDVESRRMSV